MSTYPYADRPVRVHVQADPGLALLAVGAPPAGDVERDRHQVADLDELDVAADLGDLTRDLVAECESGRRRRTAADHVLVAAADVAGDHFENRPVRRLASHVGRVDARTVLEFQGRVVDRLDRHIAWSLVDDCPVAWHGWMLLSGETLRDDWLLSV